MLHFILGHAGTGKTELLYKHILKAAENGCGAVLIVPEQYSFEGELGIWRTLGPRLALEVEVLSFTRLCDSVFRRYGGLAGVPVTKTGRYLLMSLAVSELIDRLVVYRRGALSPSFLETLVSVCAEFKTAGITPLKLEEIAAGCEEDSLREKLSDLTAVYAAYQALMERGYTDPDDDLIKTVNILSQEGYFAGKKIFIDGFATFMAGEFELLHRLITQAAEVYVAVTSDGIQDEEDGVGVFSSTKQMVRRLSRYAREAGVPVASPTVLTEPRRYKNKEMALISQGFMTAGDEFFSAAPEYVRYHEAPDPYKEIGYVASSIARLTRDEGYRYGEIAVVARDPAPYLRAFESIFNSGNIPYFLDVRRDVETMPLAGGLLAAVEAVRSNYDSEAILAYAKSPITGLTIDEAAAIENYCYAWSVRGALWKCEWKNNPRGMSGSLTAEDLAALDELNAIRKKLVEPLLALEESFRDCDGNGFAVGILKFLESVGAPEHLNDFADGLTQGDREAFLDESAQLWETIMEILDIFGTVLGSTKLALSRFYDLLRLSIASAELGLLPQTIDQVLIGGADRIRPGVVRAVFLIGAVEGEFPARVAPGGVFTDEERRRIIDMGAEIGSPGLSRAVLEKYFCYHAATLPSERLFVSVHRSKMGGAECFPSEIVVRIKALFPHLEPDRPGTLDCIFGEGTAFDTLAQRYREDTPETAALLAYFSRNKREAISRMEKAAIKPERKIENPAVARALFGTRMLLSPSRVERYHGCAFSYFAQDGLKLKKRRRVEFSSLEAGSVIHHVLQVMVQRHQSSLFGMSTRNMKKEIHEIIDGYLAERVQQLDALSPRFTYLFGRLSGMLVHLLHRLGEELSQSDYRPVAFELPIGMRADVKPLAINAAEGVTALVEGIVDRVDVMEQNGNRYVRVIDYKSGIKKFRLDDVLYGLNLQMLLYLFTISENGRGQLADCAPGGVLYMPVTGGYIGADRTTSKEELAAASLKKWRMSGLLLDDDDSLRGMEKELAGVFIPAKLGKDGKLDAYSAVAGKAEMGRISRKVTEIIGDMARQLAVGRIPALPVSEGGSRTCDFCDYRALCGFEEGDAVRTIARMDQKEVLALLEKEEENG